jgi:hypothetical protein
MAKAKKKKHRKIKQTPEPLPKERQPRRWKQAVKKSLAMVTRDTVPRIKVRVEVDSSTGEMVYVDGQNKVWSREIVARRTDLFEKETVQ